MKYSNKILTDENFDEELEILSEKIGIHHNNYSGFIKNLDSTWSRQKNNLGFCEYVKSETFPNVSGDCKQAINKGQLAYKFSNGFIVFNFETIL